jgi:hypothetical protein
MLLLDASALEASERFVWLSGRLLERLRFAHLFRGGDPARVLCALRPYQNPDGGFGEAIEPDFRGPVSQPLAVDAALRVLDEARGVDDPMARRALDYLVTITTASGGVPNVLPDVPRYPHAFWWAPRPGPQPGCLLPTASIAGLLRRHGVVHPWLERATAFCWDALREMAGRLATAAAAIEILQIAYESRAALVFLDHAPDRERAARAASDLGELLLSHGVVALDPSDPREGMMPLDLAPHPASLARRWFPDDVIEAHLDALVKEQQPDGGWPVRWQIWTPITGLEWRAIQTVERLKTLAAYGRLARPANAA